jgi:hypothetical protein
LSKLENLYLKNPKKDTLMRKHIVIVSENPISQIWFYLSRWESIEQAKLLIKEKAELEQVTLSEDRLSEKSKGLAYCLRNARDYLYSPTEELSKKILSTYYGFMSIIGAIPVSDPRSDYDLEKFEGATKMGHGIGNIDSDESFPLGQKLFVTNDGLFVRYLSYCNIKSNKFNLSTRPRDFDKIPVEDLDKMFSLDELLARVPELREFYFDVTNRNPLSIQIQSSSSANNPDHEFTIDPEIIYNGKKRNQDGTWIDLYSEFQISEAYIEDIRKMPLENIKIFRDDVYKTQN